MEVGVHTMSRCPIPGVTDLATLNPTLAKEWHPILNGDLKPSDVTVGSGKKVWWRCRHGHEWQAIIDNRRSGKSCPYCTGKLAILGETDLATKNPALAKEWHPTLNGTLKPSDVTAGSGKKVWWRCRRGHEWQATIGNRGSGKSCPYCTGKLAILGETDLATKNPSLAKEWHPTLNGTLKPSDVTVGSEKKVWWRCKAGHEWSARISHRNNGINCPYCANQRVIPGKNDLDTINPALAAEWHPTLNGDIKASDVTACSHNKVWWRCKMGHEWKASISNRSRGKKCPYCSGRLPIPGETDLATKRPALADEWHPTLNGDLKPSDVTVSSNKKVWWRCKNGHEWKASMNSRSNGNNCPYCYGRLPIPGETDLTTKNPALADEWHPILNGDIKPSDVTAGSNKKVWWSCKMGHEWKARVNSRIDGNHCPYCSGRLPIPGETDLATKSPALADEWHPTLNGDLKPSDVTVSSRKKVWWRCKNGHEWKASMNSRSNGSNCPYCYTKSNTNRSRSINKND